MRAQITNKIQFAGLTSYDDVSWTSPMRKKYSVEETPETTLHQAVQLLDPVELANVFVQNPYNEEQLIPLEMANATINPDIAAELARPQPAIVFDGGVVGHRDQAPDTEDGERMTFAVHSSEYAAVPHVEFFDPMVQAFNEADFTNIGGEFRVYDHGAKVHGEIVFTDYDDLLHLPGNREPLFIGLQVGNSYDGSCSMYAAGYAMDGYCRNSMRLLTDRRSRKHVGEAHEAVEWWEEVLMQMGALRDTLGEIITEALEVEIDIRTLPFDLEMFYELLGFPSYLARAAAVNARNRSPREGGSRMELNFWTLYSGATAALSHDFRGTSEVGSLEKYYEISKDLLWNPHNTLEKVKLAYQRQQEAEQQDSTEGSLSGQDGLAMIQRLQSSMESRKAEFEANEERMTQLLTTEN